jgi:hypothetical protein
MAMGSTKWKVEPGPSAFLAGGRDQPNLVAKRGELTGLVMCSTTCVQRYRATRLGRKEIQQLSSADPLAEYRSTPLVHSVSVKHAWRYPDRL